MAVVAQPGSQGHVCLPAPCPGCALPPTTPLCHPTGKYVENHGVVHNMFYNTSSKVKWPYHTTLGIQKWWDNGSLPIWITAQRQVMLYPRPLGQTEGAGVGPGRAGRVHAMTTGHPRQDPGVQCSQPGRGAEWAPWEMGARCP